MRKLLIGAVVAVCAGGLGLWVSNNNARALSASVDEQAQSIVAGAMHQVEAVVSGRDIQVTGLVDSEAERDALLGALGEIESLGNIEQSLEILPIAKPFTLAATLKNGQTLLQGNVPTEEMRAILAQSGAAGADGLTLASGAPDRWESAIGAGLAALSNMEEGSVSLNGTEMRLTGLVALPDDRDALISALALPQGFTLQNVHVMAGVPSVFQAMVASILPTLSGGAQLLSRTLRVTRGEGDIAGPLGEFAARHPSLSVGSYPFQTDGVYGANLVVRGKDADQLDAAMIELGEIFA
mgnify:CR=1 FL=1